MMKTPARMIMRVGFVLVLMLSAAQYVFSQSTVGIGTTNPNQNAVLELVSGDNNQGLLIPRFTTAQRTDTNFTINLSATDNGLMVFDSDEGKLYFWFVDQWVASSADFRVGAGLALSGNEIINTGDIDASDDVTESSEAAGDVSGTYFNLTVGAIQGNPIAAGTPATDQILKWDGNTWILANDENTDNQDATAVPVTPAGNLTSTDVQSALNELQGDIDGFTIPDATGLDYDNTSSELTATNVQSAIDEIDASIDGADLDSSDDVNLTTSPTGGVINGNFSTGLIITSGAITNTELAPGAVNSATISDGSITDADIDANATIAGTKITPSFGSQDITTLGNLSTNNINVTGSVNGRNIVTDATNQDALQTASGIVQGSTDIGLVSNPVVTDNQTLLSAVLQLGTELNITNTNLSGVGTVNTDGTTVLGDGDLTPLSVNASSANTANTIINRDASGDFAANDVTVNNLSATLVNGR
ncbi:MAG: hypothetical protein WBA74_24020, partial [Cyclobacteriaceae bacterium]